MFTFALLAMFEGRGADFGTDEREIMLRDGAAFDRFALLLGFAVLLVFALRDELFTFARLAMFDGRGEDLLAAAREAELRDFEALGFL